MEKLISFIIPVYNVEKYVERCILSIVSQNISADRYELIVVNDGSTDGSLDILMALKEKYSFFQIISIPNSGPSVARNTGLDVATGEYIFFIDSDDWIEPDSIPYLSEVIEKYGTDIVLIKMQELHQDGEVVSLTSSLSEDNVVESMEDYSCRYTMRSSACSGLFKRKLFRKSDYQFKAGFFCEDDDFVVKIFSVAKNVVSIHRDVYNYYQRENSTSNNSSYKFNRKLIADSITLLAENSTYIQQFTGRRYDGLKRKLDFIAVDILRFIVQKNMKKGDRIEIFSSLSKIGFYPLPKGSYGLKYNVFRFMTSCKPIFRFVAKTPLKRMF